MTDFETVHRCFGLVDNGAALVRVPISDIRPTAFTGNFAFNRWKTACEKRPRNGFHLSWEYDSNGKVVHGDYEDQLGNIIGRYIPRTNTGYTY